MPQAEVEQFWRLVDLLLQGAANMQQQHQQQGAADVQQQ